MRILLLAVGAEDLTHDQDVELVGIATGFIFEGVEGGGRKGTLAGQKEAAVIRGKEIVELGLSEAEGGLAFGSEGALPDLELRGLLGLEDDFEELFLGERFEGAFEGGGGDVS